MSRPKIRDKILTQLEECLQQTQGLLDSVRETCDNMDEYFSATERYQTLSDTQSDLEAAVQAIEDAQSNLQSCQFPSLMPRKSKSLPQHDEHKL